MTRKTIIIITVITIITFITAICGLLLLRKGKKTFDPYLTQAPTNSNFLYQNTKNAFKVYLGSRKDEKKPTARFEVGENRFVEFEAENLNAKDAKLEANKVWRYENVRDNTDITYQITENGLKEEIILKKKTALPTPGVDQETPGVETTEETPGVKEKQEILSPTPDIDPNQLEFSFLLSYPKEMEIKETVPNQLTFYEKNGPYLFHFAKPFMIDAKGEKSENIKIKVRRITPTPTPGVDCSETSPKTPGVEELAPSAPRKTPGVNGACDQLTYRLTLIPDQNWLNDSNRKYPVVLDPTIIHDTPSEFSSGAFNRTTDSGSGQTSKLETSFEELPADINTAGLWHMNETSGSSVADSSGNGNTGTATGTTIVDGKLNKARSFSGGGDYINIGSASLLKFTTAPFTIEAWIYPTDTTAENIAGNDNASDGYAVVIASGKLRFNTRGATDSYTDGNLTITANAWTHVAAVYTGATGQRILYINGREDARESFAGSITSATGDFWIGARNDSVNFFNGSIDEVRVSNVALSPEEIKTHANRRPYGVYTSPVIDFGQTPTSLNALNWVDNITPPTLPSGWTKVKPVLIDNTQNSSALTNYQVKVHVDYDSNMQTDFDDLIFTNSSGANLDYWIESKSDGVEATVWVEVDSIAASSWTTIFMFYGNSGASATSSGDNTFNFFDDFAGTTISTSKWDETDTGSNLSQNEQIILANGTATWGQTALFTDSTFARSDIELRYKFKAECERGTTFHVTTMIGWKDNGAGVSHTDMPYATYWRKEAAGTGDIYAYEDGTGRGDLGNFSCNTQYWGKMQLKSSGANYYYSTDNTNWTLFYNSTYSTETPLKIGFTHYEGGDNLFDNIFVRKYTSPEPTASVGASVEFETRTGSTSSPPDGWEGWKPTTNETAIDNMDSPSWGLQGIKPTSISNGSEHVYNAASTAYVSTTSLDSTHFVVAYQDGGDSNHGKAIIGTVSGTTISYGSEYEFNAGGSEYISVEALDSSRFAAAYRDTDNSNYGTAILGTVSGSTISYGSEYVFNSADTYHNFITALDNDRFAIAYQDSGTARGTAIIGTVSGTTISYGSEYEYNNAGSSNLSATTLDSNHFAVVFWDAGNSNYGTAAVGMTSGSTISFTSEYVYNAIASSYNSAVTLDSYHFAVAFYDYGTTSGTAMVETVVYTSPPLISSGESTTKMEGAGSLKTIIGAPQVDTNTVALWHMEETSGTGAYIKDSASTNHGTPTGTSATNGFFGKARSFNGSSDYIDAGNSSSERVSFGTIEAWIKTNSTATQFAAGVPYDDGAVWDSPWVGFQIGTSNNQGRFWLNVDGTNREFTAGTISTGRWHYVVLTYDGAMAKGYIDGVQVGSSAYSGSITYGGSPSLVIGVRSKQSQGEWFNGSVDEVKLSNTSRTPEEIAEAYRAGRDHRLEKTLSSTDLSAKNKIPFYVASDRPGTNLEAYIGETTNSVYGADANTVGSWHLEEQSGSGAYIKDSSGNSNNGTPTSTTFTQGKIGKGRSFNGSSDYINVSDASTLDITSNLNLDAWIYPIDATTNATNPTIVGKFNSDGANTRSYLLGWGTSSGNEGKILFVLSPDGTSSTALWSNSTVSLNQWHHIAGVFDDSANTMKIYIDSKEDNSTSYTSSIYSGASALGIGGNANYTNRFKGIIDEVRVSNTARSATEIQQAYQYGLRTHPITTDFVTSPQATYASGTSITINNPWGTSNLTDTLSVGDTMIIRENENGTEYISQTEVSAITNTSSTYGTVTLASAFSSIPPSGYTTNAKVFKWQREYWDIKDISEADRNAATKLGVRVLDGSQGFTFWLDDFRSNSNYLYLPFGNTITSTANRYFQYRAIITGTDGPPSSSNTQNTATPQISRVTVNYTLTSDEKDGRPVAQWKFDEGYGSTAYDETINNHDAILNNMESTDWVTGYEGKALNLGGTDEYLSVANSADVNFGDRSMSISAFVNITSSGATYPILGKYSSSKGYNLYINASGKVIFQIGDGANTPSVTSNTSVNDGRWHSILAVRAKGSTLKIYIDGVYDNQASDTANNIDSTGDVVISESAGYIGKLDELNLYDYALSSSQAKVVYNKGYGAVLGATKDVNKGGSGPVGFWKMDEASGQYANDSSGQGNQGTLGANSSSGSDDPTWTTAGKIGNALNFDNSNDYVKVADPGSSPLDITGNSTYEAWIYPLSLPTSDATRTEIITKTDSWSTGNYVIELYTSGTFRFSYVGGGGWRTFNSTSSITTANAWHHIAVVFDWTNTRLAFYIDGVQDSAGWQNVTYDLTTSNDNFLIGAAWYSGAPFKVFNGQIDHVKIYNYSRSTAQIHADMGGSPIGYWKFDEGYGATAYDETTNNNDGTLTNMESTDWVAGKYGKALDFDGSNEYVNLANDSNFDLTEGTITAWIKATTQGGEPRGAIYTHGNTGFGSDSSEGSLQFWLDYAADYPGKVLFRTINSSSTPSPSLVSNTTVNTGQWFFVAASWNTSINKLYINGVLEDSDSGVTARSASETLIGMNTRSNRTLWPYKGKIDEPKIYNYPLTPDEIKVEYNQNSAVRLGNTLDINAAGSGPVGYWKMDEATGTSANDSSGNGNTGTINGASWTTSGKIGSALDFDGSDDYVSIPASSVFNFSTNSFSYTARANFDALAASEMYIIDRTTASTPLINLYVNSNGTVVCRIRDTSGNIPTATSTSTVSASTWYHYMCVRNTVSDTLKLYVNGREWASVTDTTTAPVDLSTVQLKIGAHADSGDGTRLWNGVIDDVKIYNYARSQKQIAMDYNGGKPVAWWKLDEATGITAYDESDNNNDGTLTNMENADHVNGKIGRALDFDGTDDYITVPAANSINLYPKTGYTISAWIKPDTDGESDTGNFFRKGNSYLRVDTEGGGTVEVSALIDLATDDATVNTTETIPTGQWSHITAVWEDDGDDEVSIYINGRLSATSSDGNGSTADDSASALNIGGNAGAATFDGKIDDVRIYNYARTADEVKLDYNNGAVSFK